MTRPTDDDHGPEGLAADLRTLATRRRALAVLGLTGLGVAGGWAILSGAAGRAEATVSGTAADGSVCVEPAAETAGPFPGDGTNSRAGQTVNVLTETGIRRTDLRPSFGGLNGTAEGLPLQVEIRLIDVANGCAPLPGHAVYLWHCDAVGRYSLYDLPDANYLRGLGVSDKAGVVRFTTVFPGCYDGRWPHFHFEVFASPEAAGTGRDALLTSQFALPQADCAAVYRTEAVYAASKANLARQSVSRDTVFRGNTAAQMAVMTLTVRRDAGAGLSATATVGIARA